MNDVTLAQIAGLDEFNKGQRKQKMGPLWKSTEQMLRNFYQPHNDKLGKLLNDMNFTWKYTQ